MNCYTNEMITTEHEQKVEAETQIVVDNFLIRAQHRNWSTNNLQIDEIREREQMLSPTTIALIEGFMGVESFLPDYLSEGFRGLEGIPSRMTLHNQWGTEEARHGPGLRLVLLCSGVRSEAELKEYEGRIGQNRWAASQHTGLDNPMGAAIYIMLQERGTYVNYQGLHILVRQDYGLPQGLTEDERERGQEIGAAEVISKIAKDEIAHHVINLQLVRIYLKYFPEETLEKVRQVVSGFRMPALNLLPNRHQFIKALHTTRIYDRTIYQRQVLEPTLKSLGIANV